MNVFIKIITWLTAGFLYLLTRSSGIAFAQRLEETRAAYLEGASK